MQWDLVDATTSQIVIPARCDYGYFLLKVRSRRHSTSLSRSRSRVYCFPDLFLDLYVPFLIFIA